MGFQAEQRKRAAELAHLICDSMQPRRRLCHCGPGGTQALGLPKKKSEPSQLCGAGAFPEVRSKRAGAEVRQLHVALAADPGRRRRVLMCAAHGARRQAGCPPVPRRRSHGLGLGKGDVQRRRRRGDLLAARVLWRRPRRSAPRLHSRQSRRGPWGYAQSSRGRQLVEHVTC